MSDDKPTGTWRELKMGEHIQKGDIGRWPDGDPIEIPDHIYGKEVCALGTFFRLDGQEQVASEPTDTQRLDKLEAYLCNDFATIYAPSFTGDSWMIKYHKDRNKVLVEGPTLRDAIDSLPDEKGKL